MNPNAFAIILKKRTRKDNKEKKETKETGTYTDTKSKIKQAFICKLNILNKSVRNVLFEK